LNQQKKPGSGGARSNRHNHPGKSPVGPVQAVTMGPNQPVRVIHDYHDINTGVLASSLAKRAPGYTSLGFPDPRR